ncbi:uncharacterized protein OCT59_024448 [Rhizophagus irregularis]|uniref:uncharacterized protein n=1 Tax=Rhizophagus irregularis TaxID=588596 RepID=UPI000CBC3B01|nr:hypothetical protein OCT59_024448 [Rhizophagus irregularis]CAG8582167.1 10852_t:CDS:2 [Rhizophagus irregularis]
MHIFPRSCGYSDSQSRRELGCPKISAGRNCLRFFLKTSWYKRFLIEYLQFKKTKILTGLKLCNTFWRQTTRKCFPCHHEAADAKNTSALCYFRIWMRRHLSNFVQKAKKSNSSTVEMKYIKQIKFSEIMLNLKVMFSRFAAEDSNNEIDAATERDKKRKELDKDNEYTSTPT